ncbi:transcriptional regulator [Streptococcus ferus]|uniref:Transcriptional regulator n=2 Tax=Streptococcus ferus TaxID=1345 RepID=A0A2X3VIZ7_9STRE|nr:transcriptional regulator [Streptococcus ferus]
MTGYQTKRKNTKTYLREAFFSLLEERPINQVTVSALTKKAGISRGTFYLHYLDINDFIQSIKSEIYSVIEEHLQDDLFHDAELSKLTFLIDYVEDTFAVFKALIGKNGDKAFEAYLIRAIKRFILGHAKVSYQDKTIPETYVIDILTMSVIAIIYTWLDEENPRTSREIIDIIVKTRTLSPADLYRRESVMYTLNEIRKASDGILFDDTFDLEAALRERNPEILGLEGLEAKGKVVYDDGFYVLDYYLTYTITLPSSRSLEPVQRSEQLMVEEVFIESQDVSAKKDLVEEELVIILEDPVIDLKESILDNILLNIPLKVLTPDEEANEELPSGKDWQIISQAQYEELKEKNKEAENPFAALSNLFDDENQ